METPTPEPAKEAEEPTKRKRRQPKEKRAKKPRKKRRFLRFFVFVLLLGAVGLGVTYNLAKRGLVRLPQKPFLMPLYAKIGLKPTSRKVATAKAPDPLAEEKQKLNSMRESFQKEHEDWERLKQAQVQSEAEAKAKVLAEAEIKKQEAKRAEEEAKKTPPPSTIDPKSLARMAAVYEEMPIAKLSKIFAVLPDDEVIQLLRRMDEKKVAEVLAEEKPARAARFSLTLSKAPKETAGTK